MPAVGPERKVEIIIEIAKGSGGSSFIKMIMDNGNGMDTKGLREFATYSLDQRTRNNVAEENDKSYWSVLTPCGTKTKFCHLLIHV
jgi:hypothetical protein